MEIVSVIVIFTFLSQRGGEASTALPIGSDAWVFCHGMPLDVFKATCACMLKLKQYTADEYGADSSKVDHWPVIGDRIYSKEDCIQEMEKIIPRRRKKRKFYNSKNHYWTFPVLYSFHEDVNPDDKIMIDAAMSHWQNETCVKFEHFDPLVHDSDVQRLFFTNRGDGCYSYIGRQGRSVFPQQINLQSRGCTGWIGVVVHEIGHSLGLFHEQNRLDRNFWVTFYAQQVDSNVISNFKPEPLAHDFGVPYDYGSVMQYDNRAFSSRGGVVLEATLPYSEYTMGQRGFTSYLDAKVVNRAYCSAECVNTATLPCHHNGYMDPNDCTKCRCPEGFGGQLCETAADSDPECSPYVPILEATNQIQCLKSPGYDTDLSYPIGAQCNWIIQAPPGEKIRARFDGPFGVYCSGSNTRGPMCFHWVEVKFKIDKEIRGGRFCCYDDSTFAFNKPGVIVSEDNKMVVHFNARWPQVENKYTAPPRPTARRGFKLCFALNSLVDFGNATEQANEDKSTDESPDEWWYPTAQQQQQSSSASPMVTPQSLFYDRNQSLISDANTYMYTRLYNGSLTFVVSVLTLFLVAASF